MTTLFILAFLRLFTIEDVRCSASQSVFHCMPDTIPFEFTVTTYVPGSFCRTVTVDNFIVQCYEGMITVTKVPMAKIDTLFISSNDTTYTCEEVGGDTLMSLNDDTYKPLSILGTVISYEHSWYADGGAHPTYGTEYCTKQLGALEDTIEITNLVDEDELLKAFLADTLIQRYLGSQHPADVSQLVEMLGEDCEIDFRDMLKSWAIRNVSSDSVDIEFGLRYGCEAMRGTFSVVDVSVPFPDERRSMFLDAKKDRTTMMSIGDR